MAVLRTIPIILSFLLLGAHFLRIGNIGLTITCIATPLLLFIRRSWIPTIFRLLLIIGGLVWVDIAVKLTHIRIAMNMPWIRMAIILGSVAIITVASSLTFSTKSMKRWYSPEMKSRFPSAAAFILTVLSLGFVQTKVAIPMLILERFVPGLGWLEVLGLGIYAAWITEKMLDPNRSSLWRIRIWLVFSFVFFAQLALGLAGAERFLLTGDLHLPVPAVIAAGPIYRGDSFFMPILLGATLMLVGPAWCSHLCYIGSWDHIASLQKKRPRPLPSWARPLRISILVLVPATAIGLKLIGASTIVAAGVALAFGGLGVLVMATWSRKSGSMTHCTVYCPIGLIAVVLGKISPFRIRIMNGCNDCMKCRKSCRYDALSKSDIVSRRPGLNCTLCGDCLGTCKDGQIEYRFAGLSGDRARTVFLVLVVSLHAIFMGVARM